MRWENKEVELKNKVFSATVSGVYFLFAINKAGEDCPYIRQIDETGAFFISLLKTRPDFESAVNEIVKEYGVQRNRASSDFAGFIQQLEEEGYLLLS